MLFRLSLGLALAVSLPAAETFRGAAMPWTTYEAEDMSTTGEKLGPQYEPNRVETEASRQRCVRLAKAGQFVEFTAAESANAMVVRYSLPDAPGGGGLDSSLNLYRNGTLWQKLPLTSRYSWLYGRYPFTNAPAAGKPRNFFDELRVKGLSIAKGDVLRLQREATDAGYCLVDLVDLERVAPPRAAPADSLSVTHPRFGAAGNGTTDDTAALRECIKAAQREGKVVWVPAGDYQITGDIDLPGGVTVQGAGLWHTTFVGDAAVYGDARRRVRFNGWGGNIHLADFAILGKLNFRNDAEPNDGLTGWFGENSTLQRLWVEHTKAGVWVNNSSNLVVAGCRFRNTLADGLNFCVGMRNSTATNCTARGTGDDGFAIWPATHALQDYAPGGNCISHCTAQFPFLANGAAIYGGASNRMEGCRFLDIAAGCGILISSSFPTADPAKDIDNNFSGTTTVSDCELIRCGGYDHEWAWRAALQLCLDRRSISGLIFRDIAITESISDGFGIDAPGSRHGEGVLGDARIQNLTSTQPGLGLKGSHGLVVRPGARGSLAITHSRIDGETNHSPNFNISHD